MPINQYTGKWEEFPSDSVLNFNTPGNSKINRIPGIFQNFSKENSFNQMIQKFIPTPAIGSTQWEKNQYGETNTEKSLGSTLQSSWKGIGKEQKGALVGQGINLLSSLIPDKTQDDPLTGGIDAGWDMAANAASAIPGYGTIIGGTMKAAGLLNKGINAIGGGINNASNTGDKIMNSTLGSTALLPLKILNAVAKTKVEGSDTDLAAKVTKGYSAERTIASTEIGGVTNFISKLFGNKKGLLANKRAAIEKINTTNALKSNAIDLDKNNTLAGMNSMQDINSKNRQALTSGLNNSYKNQIVSGKLGTKINPAKLRNLKNKVKKKIFKAQEGQAMDGEVIKYAIGGKMNVIPEGALHKNLNHYDGDLGSAVTNKGIPVITVEDGKIEQHAEIEKNEIIFHKEATDKMEEFFTQFNDTEDPKEKDQICIECGKFVTEELLENTQDNTNLINTI